MVDAPNPAGSEPEPQSMEFKAEVQQLLHILAHSLYTNREIFLRELLSNASDALNRIQFEMLTNQDVLDPEAELAIILSADKDNKTLTISDTGIGMTREEMAENLGTIAHSGAAAFLRTIQDENRSADDIIGQFGVGFYSVFMVADEVTVISRSYHPESTAWMWRSQGDNTYTLEPADKADRGTSVVIQLKDDAVEFAENWRLQAVIKKHSNYVSYPIYMDEEAVNQQTALWRKSPSEVEEAEYAEFYKQLTLDPGPALAHLHLVTDAPVDIRALLFIPSKRERSFLNLRTEQGLKLYCRKVLIQEYNRDLLPGYFRFVEGVVDSEDLPLNISRETVQSNPMLRQVSRVLTKRLVKDLGAMAEERPQDYLVFWREFGIYLKEGVATDPSSLDSLPPLLRFHSSQAGGENDLISLAEYVSRMQEDQKEIYYVLGDDLKSAARSPHLDPFHKNGIEVLYLVDPLDSFLTMAMREFDGKPLRNVADSDLEMPVENQAETDAEKINPSQTGELLSRFKQVLGDQVADVTESRRLTDNLCRLVSPETGPDRELERVRRLMEQDYAPPQKILELNLHHPLIRKLAQLVTQSPEDGIADAAIQQILDNALAIDGLPPNPADVAPRVESLMEAAIESRLQPNQSEQDAASDER